MNLLTLLLAATLYLFQTHTDNQWPQITKNDLEQIHTLITEKYKNNPHYRSWLTHGRHQTLPLVHKTTDLKGYTFALQYYVNGFHNPYINLITPAHDQQMQWPGFLVYKKANEFIVYGSTIEHIPNGSRLVLCNDKPPQELLKTNILNYFGNIDNANDHERFAPYLLLDIGNPFAEPITHCSIKSDSSDEVTTVTLSWKPIAKEALSSLDSTLYTLINGDELIKKYAHTIVPLTENRAYLLFDKISL